MAETKLVGPELRNTRHSRQGHRPREIFGRFPRAGHAVRPAAVESVRAREDPQHRHERCAGHAGRKAILLPEDVPGPKDQVNDMGQTLRANPYSERALATEPLYQGEPVLAVAAVDEADGGRSDREDQDSLGVLPFNVDPVATLRPVRRPRAWRATSGCARHQLRVSLHRFRRSRI